jgi:ABC-2 type transport system ATP-binding protein
MEMIKLINLTKIYKGLKAVDNLNLDVRDGIIYGFLGPNGAGKTTTIKMMAGVLKPTKGNIIINGMDISRSPSDVKRITGFIPDRPFLYEKLTGMEFLRFIAGLYNLDHSQTVNNHLMDLLEKFDLTHWRDELIESYSHGMKQRLVMCGALLHNPKLLIVDEPMVGLDPKGAKLAKDIFKELAAKGTTIFMSTHSLEVAQEVCKEIAIIQAGKVIASGTESDLRDQAGIEGNLETVFLKLTEGKGIAHERSLSFA